MRSLRCRASRSAVLKWMYRFAMRGHAIFRGHIARARICKTATQLHKLTVPGFRNCWCGYYDHSPFYPKDESLILLHAANWPAWRMPRPDQPVEVMLFDWRARRVVESLGPTFSWNWQQGARAHWVLKDTVIYNIYDAETGSYRAKLVQPGMGRHELLPIPVQETDVQGRVYSISYEALSAIRPDYGYRNKPCTQRDIMENRIRSYDLRSGEIREHVGVPELFAEASARHAVPMDRPKLNHVMASPGGTRLIFLFRYFAGGRRVTDLYGLDVESGRWNCLLPDKGVSHCCWIDERSILATLRGREGFGYYKLDFDGADVSLVRLSPDGHPQALNEHLFVTDTYPDRFAMRRLLSVPYAATSGMIEWGVFPEPLLFLGEARCDLHPSVSPSRRWAQMDLAYKNRRLVGLLEMPDL